MFFSEFLETASSSSRLLTMCLHTLFLLALFQLAPAPVYKSRMYTNPHLQLRFFVQVSAISGDFALFPKDLYIISRRQGRSLVQARLVHRGRASEATPPPKESQDETSTNLRFAGQTTAIEFAGDVVLLSGGQLIDRPRPILRNILIVNQLT